MNNIAKLRQRAKLTQLELALLLEVDPGTIRNLERGRTWVEQIERFVKLCDILECSPKELISGPSVELEAWLESLGVEWNNELGDVKSLNLVGLKIADLPEAIGQLSNLRDLFLNANELKHLPESIGHLASLEFLDLSENELVELPEAIGQLANLKELYLQDNQLTSLPESIGQLKKLRYLYIAGNSIADLSPLEGLPKLTIYQEL